MYWASIGKDLTTALTAFCRINGGIETPEGGKIIKGKDAVEGNLHVSSLRHRYHSMLIYEEEPKNCYLCAVYRE